MTATVSVVPERATFAPLSVITLPADDDALTVTAAVAPNAVPGGTVMVR